MILSKMGRWILHYLLTRINRKGKNLFMEEVDLKELFLYFYKRMIIIIAIVFLCVLAGFVYTMFIKIPVYEGKTTLLMINKNSDNSGSGSVTQSDISLNQKLVSTYTQIVKSRKVLNQVIKNLNLRCTYSQLYNRVSVSNISDTEIIKIAVSDSDPENAAKIANTVASVFSNEITNIYHLENVTIIDSAEAAKSPYNINLFKTMIICFVAGIAISFMILFILYYFDTSIKSQEEVEQRLEIAVIGNVPQVGGKKVKKWKNYM